LPRSKHILDQLETLLKSEFFAVIKESCGSSVAKYWLTGVLPAFRDGISPLTATRVISFNERYHSLCGLTQENVNAIVKRALPESKQAHTLDSLKRWYNGYMFSFTSSGSENLTLYNPRLVFDHLQAAISDEISSSHIDEANATHTATVLSVVGETGPVAINDLINMLYSKVNARVLRELSFVELTREQEMRPRDVTWSLLYYLGIVTFCESAGCPQGMQSLRVPNGSMVHLVSPRTLCLEGLIIDLILAD
jgi:Predicted AAA-ATPase